MTSVIQVDGLTIEYGNGVLKVNGKEIDISEVKSSKSQRNKETKINTSKTIEGDVNGNLREAVPELRLS